MPIAIQSINVVNLGPLAKFELQPKGLNLIYGHNEKGKTYLVEFLTRCLFKSAAFKYARGSAGQGMISVSGLKENLVNFSLKSRETKLEDYLPQPETGLPPSLARLLLVRAGDLSLADDQPGGVNSVILKEYLSRQGFLDRIRGRIKPAIQNAKFSDSGEIGGPQQGELKTRDTCLNQLRNLDALIHEFQVAFSDGHRLQLREELEALRMQSAELTKARRFLAYQLSRELQTLEVEQERLSRDKFSLLTGKIEQYRRLTEDLLKKQSALDEKIHLSEPYDWLVSAHTVYGRLLEASAGSRLSPVWKIMAALLIIAALVLIWLRILLPAAVAILVGAALGAFYIWKLEKFSDNQASQELLRLQNDFEERFHCKLTSLASLDERITKVQPEHEHKKILANDVRDLENETILLQNEISSLLAAFGYAAAELQSWDLLCSQLEAAIGGLERKKNEVCVRLEVLAVSPELYLYENPGTVFDSQYVEDVNERIHKFEDDLRAEDEQLKALVSRASVTYGIPTGTTSLEAVLEVLNGQREKLAADYRLKTAEIAGKMVVNEILNGYRAQEEENIRRELTTESITAPLYQVTGRYRAIDYEGGSLQVADDYGTYPLSDLSTATQEQVLLALRMGFASNLFQQQPMFMVLDDAFQHSDWERRERLVDQAIQFHSLGWQIFYFTMDDHLRDLFRKKGELAAGDQFIFKSLG